MLTAKNFQEFIGANDVKELLVDFDLKLPIYRDAVSYSKTLERGSYKTHLPAQTF